jgi:hypothetical protein
MARNATLALLLVAGAARADLCSDVMARIGDRLAPGASCVPSADLTTNNPATTPLNNSIGLPPFAFTPRTDRDTITPGATHRPPVLVKVPGVQIDAALAADRTGEARFLLRLPENWNGKLVVAGASGTRSEFNGDFAWSDYVLQQGYAYASQNKGVLNFHLTDPDPALAAPGKPSDPLACRLAPFPAGLANFWVHFYDLDPQKPFWEWQFRIVEAAAIAREGVRAAYGKSPERTYAVGTSNGGYQVRRAIELAPGLFDGGVDWEGTFVDGETFNLLTDLPPAVKNFPFYLASGYDPNSAAARNIEAAGYPPDIVVRNSAGNVTASLWQTNFFAFWEVTLCQWQKRLDPGYDTYRLGTGNYDYFARTEVSDVQDNLEAFANTGRIKAPLITVAGTMDALLPIKHHARAYADKVAEARRGDEDEEEEEEHGHPAYRLYEVQNGNHIETYKDTVSDKLELIQPHARRAFDLLVDFVEKGKPLPPDQCIPRGGAIAGAPVQAGRCEKLLVP